MKKNLMFFVVLPVLFMLITGLTWHTANQRTVEWDPVTTNSNGDPIDLAETTVVYNVFLRDAITAGAPVQVATAITATQEIITLTNEGSFYVGVSSQRKLVDTGELLEESTISWSDDPTVCLNGQDFGIRYFLAGAPPVNLR
jgi:hypothetical protein